VQKKKLKKIYFSSQKLPKQQSTSFWSQGILGVNEYGLNHWKVDYGEMTNKKVKCGETS
jgi:hypothetical protein